MQSGRGEENKVLSSWQFIGLNGERPVALNRIESRPGHRVTLVRLADESKNEISRHGAVNPAVRAAVTVVTQDKIFAGSEQCGLDQPVAGGPDILGGEIGFGKFGVVHVNAVLPDFHNFIGHGNDALDGKVMVLRVADDDDFALAWRAPEIGAAIQNVTLAVQQSWPHAGAFDFDP